MVLLQIIGILLIVDVLFPSLAGLLQVMVLTADEKCCLSFIMASIASRCAR